MSKINKYINVACNVILGGTALLIGKSIMYDTEINGVNANELQITKLNAVKNQLVKTQTVYDKNNDLSQLQSNTKELIQKARDYGRPLSTGRFFRRLEDAIDSKPYVHTDNGPLISSDESVGVRTFIDPVPTDRFRDPYPGYVIGDGYGEKITRYHYSIPMHRLLSDFAEQVKREESDKFAHLKRLF